MFPQDGVLAHFSHELRIALNVRFPNRWIGRGWSHEFQTFHHWIFFLRGSIKYRAYAEEIRVIRHLREQANVTLATVTPEVLQRA